MKRALVVDDSNTMRTLVANTLEGAGFETIRAEDGQHALEILGEQEIAVVATDYNMPNMNGVELVKALRQKPQYQYTPILLISTETDDQIKQQAREVGASGWVRKTFEASTLLAAISKVCGLEL